MKTLGILGGLGPMATARFLELVTEMTEASCDQEHIESITYSRPQIADRTAYILDRAKADPFPAMAETGLALKRMGAQVLAMPCITAHYFYEELVERIGLPILNAIEETAFHLKRKGIAAAGILATDGTIATGLFQKEFEKQGIAVFVPEPEEQKLVMDMIYKEVKTGKPISSESFRRVTASLAGKGAGTMVLGCTELSMAGKCLRQGKHITDVMEVLAAVAVTACGAKLAENNMGKI